MVRKLDNLPKWDTITLTESGRNALLRLARETIAARLSDQSPPVIPEAIAIVGRAGVFVTLRIDDDLRGCIGDMSGSRSLADAVQYAAVGSAFRDPRFPPVEPQELEEIAIEISVLTPLQRITDPASIEIGTHGLVLQAGQRVGLLLPQVATDRDWDTTQFLEAVSRKAGLPANGWRQPDAELYVFSAEVFEEHAG